MQPTHPGPGYCRPSATGPPVLNSSRRVSTTRRSLWREWPGKYCQSGDNYNGKCQRFILWMEPQLSVNYWYSAIQSDRNTLIWQFSNQTILVSSQQSQRLNHSSGRGLSLSQHLQAETEYIEFWHLVVNIKYQTFIMEILDIFNRNTTHSNENVNNLLNSLMPAMQKFQFSIILPLPQTSHWGPA